MDSKERSAKVEKLLQEVISDMEDHEDGDLLLDWIVIAYVDNPDDEKGGAYPMIYSNGEMPSYRARGLLETGLLYLLLNTATGEDDE